jgi:hypothetical protein
MKRIIAILIFLVPVYINAQKPWYKSSPDWYAWKIVGNEGFSPGKADCESLAINQSGEPYVAFQDYSTVDNGRVTVMKYNGTSWENIGSPNFTNGPAFYLSFALSQSGEPYVAFMDYNLNEKVSVMKFNGTDWIYVGSAGFSLGSAYDLDLVFSPSGEPYLAYRDRITPYDQKATVMKFNGVDWISVGQPGFTPGDAHYESLAFGPDGNPYIAFEDCFQNCKASLMKFDGTNWIYVGSPGFSTGDVWYISLAFDQDGVPYVAFDDCGHSNRVSVMKLSGSSWGYVGAPGFLQGSSFFVSLAFGQDGNPYVAFQDWINSCKATVMKFEGSGWGYLGDVGFSEGHAEFTSIVFSSSGIPYVAFSDYENDSMATVMIYDSVYVGTKNPRLSRFSIYPNPATDKITIESSLPSTERNMTIINTYGQELIKQNIISNKSDININFIPAGVYFIRLINETSIEFGTLIKE